MPALERIQQLLGSQEDEYRARARELLRVSDPHYDLDNPTLIDAITAEMLKVRQETVDELKEPTE